jgi:hypothetical protein
MGLADVRRQAREIRAKLLPPRKRIIAALCWGDHCRVVLWETGLNENVCMAVSDLPRGVRIFRVDPAKNLGMIFLGPEGEPHLQIIVGIGERDMWGDTFCTDTEHCHCDQSARNPDKEEQ